MDHRLVKQLGYVAFMGGVASIVGSAAVYLLGQRNHMEERRNTGVFIGLWAPTFFAIAEMLDRLSVEDRTYMGVPIERPSKIEETARTLVRH